MTFRSEFLCLGPTSSPQPVLQVAGNQAPHYSFATATLPACYTTRTHRRKRCLPQTSQPGVEGARPLYRRWERQKVPLISVQLLRDLLRSWDGVACVCCLAFSYYSNALRDTRVAFPAVGLFCGECVGCFEVNGPGMSLLYKTLASLVQY